MERSNLSPGQRGRCPAKPFLLEAGISQTVPAWCRGVGLLVWTIWPGFYIPQDFSITGLGGVERPSGQHFLVLISPEARSLQLSSKYFQVSQHHLKWAVLQWCRWHLRQNTFLLCWALLWFAGYLSFLISATKCEQSPHQPSRWPEMPYPLLNTHPHSDSSSPNLEPLDDAAKLGLLCFLNVLFCIGV